MGEWTNELHNAFTTCLLCIYALHHCEDKTMTPYPNKIIRIPKLWWTMTRYLGEKNTTMIQCHIGKVPYVIMLNHNDEVPMYKIFDQRTNTYTGFKSTHIEYSKTNLRNMIKRDVMRGELILC